MPMIKIEYDNKKVKKEEIILLSEAIQKIVAEATNIEDVFVYANNSQIKIKVAPIEIFIEMSAHKINNEDNLMGEIKSRISKWKKKNSFTHLINLSLIPLKWKIEIGI